MYRLLGPHVNLIRDAGHLRGWQPPVMVALDPGADWLALAAEMPRTKPVWRFFHEGQPDFGDPAMDPAAAARSSVARDLRRMLALAGAGGYFQGENEPAIGSAEGMRRYGAFEIERVKVLAGHGLKAAVGGFAVGNPPNMAWWAEFVPALKAAAAAGGVLLLHEYAWPRCSTGGPGCDPVWTSLRHRMVYDGCPEHGWAGLPEGARLPLIVGECGADKGTVLPGQLGGWRDVMTQEEYLADLAAYSLELEKDTYVLGAAVYCDGSESWMWAGYDIWPNVESTLTEQARPLYRQTPQPPASGGPKRGCDVSAHQGIVDYVRVRQEGIGFVLARASVGAYEDRRWSSNRSGALGQFLAVEPYHYLTTDVRIEDQAKVFLKATGAGWMTWWIDVEWETRTGAGPNEAQVREMVDRLQQAGKQPGIYTSRYMWGTRCHQTGWAGHLPLWCADWSSKFYGNPRLPAGWTKWRYQQTSSSGSVAGISGRVDLDIAR